MNSKSDDHLSQKWLKWMILVFLFLIWFVNGFFFKILNLVPRHAEIVAQILRTDHAQLFTKIIGIGEILISLWVLSGIRSRLSSWIQIILILTMNILEFILLPEMLLFGKLNLLFAFGLCFLIFWSEYRLHTKTAGLWPWFKSQPFDVRAHFEFSLVLTFSIPIEQAVKILPAPLLPDTFKEQYAFIAIAIVKCKGLRPVFLPSIFGQDFHLTGYRIFSKYLNIKEKQLRGLYILQSRTDKKLMKYLGRVFTRYKYRSADIILKYENNTGMISSKSCDLSITFKQQSTENKLPEQSVFTSWKEARKFAGPLPFTFSVDRQQNEILIIEGVRKNWDPEPVEILNFKIPFLKDYDAQLASAFMIKDVPYSWKKGKIEHIGKL